MVKFEELREMLRRHSNYHFQPKYNALTEAWRLNIEANRHREFHVGIMKVGFLMQKRLNKRENF